MFSKAYKLKSNNTLKNSEKKHLAQRVKDAFASTTEEKIKELVPVKSNSSCMKLVLHSGDPVGVYVVDGVPTLIEVGDQLVPTVCALWKVPHLVPMLNIHTLVLPKVLGGAPVYLPGVTIPAAGVGFPQFRKGDIVSACTSENAAAALVGRAAMSSGDMLLRAVGTCLESIQVFGDLLCKEPKFSRIERPSLGPPAAHGADPAGLLAADITQLSIQPLKEEWPSLGPRPEPPPPNEPALIPEPAHAETAVDHEPTADTDNDDTLAEDSSQTGEDGVPTDMDGLLRWCLLCFLKAEAKNIELPLKTNLLYKNHLMPYCPADRTLDVKKSTYKKMGKFLDAMQQEGLVEVREVEKGVSALVAVNPAHPALRAHQVLHAPRETRAEPRAEEGGPQYVPPQVREMFCVTAACSGLLSGHRRGTPLSSAEVRAALTEYVRSRALASAEKKGAVAVDGTLAKLLGKPEQELVKWDELMASVLGKMTASTEMRFADGSVKFNKSKLEPITMQVASRSGNKKVTLVSNLEAFGFNLQALSQVCQHGVAASCGVTRSPAAKHDQLMLQGDQTHYVAKLLIENYGLPKKFVEGADKALKKKK